MNNAIQIVAKYLLGVSVLWKQDCLRLDSKGYCSLRTDDELDILLEVKAEAGELLFIADLGENLKEHHAARLLHENLFFNWLRCATFCREATQGRVFLRYHYPIEAMSEEKLSALLCNFVATARTARDLVVALASGKEASMPASHSSGAKVDKRKSFSSAIKGMRNNACTS